MGIRVDTGSFLAIVVAAAFAATLSTVIGSRGLFIPVVVIELGLGVLIGPQLLDLAHVDGFTEFFADLGLGMLFFFAGYEIDIARIRGEPLRLALFGWAMSLAIAYTLGGALAILGVVVSLVYVGSALATTAIGTLIPVLSDTGELRTRFGTYLLAAGAVGEFGPILLLTLVLSTQSARAQRAHPGRLRGAGGGGRGARGPLRRAGRCRCSRRRSSRAPSWRSAGSWSWSSRSRCSRPTWASICFSAGSRQG